MTNLTWQIEGALVPSDFEDVTTPLGKATQIYARALTANEKTVKAVTFNGKTIEIEELAGVNHA